MSGNILLGLVSFVPSEVIGYEDWNYRLLYHVKPKTFTEARSVCYERRWCYNLVNASTYLLCMLVPHHHHNRFTALFPGPPGWAGARRELLDFMVQGEINRGRHTNHPAGRHSIRTNQRPPPPSSHMYTYHGV